MTIGVPGYRPDEELREIAREIVAGSPAIVSVRELSHDLLHGRAVGEVPRIIADELRAAKVRIAFTFDELGAMIWLIEESEPEDVVLVLSHLDHHVEAFLKLPTPP